MRDFNDRNRAKKVTFADHFIRETNLTMDEPLEKAPAHWYIAANAAQALGLVAFIL